MSLQMITNNTAPLVPLVVGVPSVVYIVAVYVAASHKSNHTRGVIFIAHDLLQHKQYVVHCNMGGRSYLLGRGGEILNLTMSRNGFNNVNQDFFTAQIFPLEILYIRRLLQVLLTVTCVCVRRVCVIR